jgi:hypothetical protein
MKSVASMALNIVANTPKYKTVEGLNTKQKSELGKLTFEAYYIMSKNIKVKNMIARALEIDDKKLTEVCDIAIQYKEEIESSFSSFDKKKYKKQVKSLSLRSLKDVVPKFLKERPARPARPAGPAGTNTQISIQRLPLEVLSLIKTKLEELLKPDILYDWINPEKLNHYYLSTNYNAINYLKKKENRWMIDYRGLSKNTNPDALDLLKKQIKREEGQGSEGSKGSKSSSYSEGSEGSSYSQGSEGSSYSQGSSASQDSIDWDELSKNSNAMPILKKQIEKEKAPGAIRRINWHSFCSNPHPDTIDLLEEKIKENPDNIGDFRHWGYLSSNTSNEAIEYLKKNRGNINWWILSGNTNPEAIILLKQWLDDAVDNSFNLNWHAICQNENAMDIINAVLQNDANMKWGSLMSNTSPEAIDIIKGRLATHPSKTFSSELCSNPSAMDILLADKDKINWFGYSANTNNTINKEAIAILKEKIKKDVNGNIINWNLLSANTSIFKVGLG